MHAERSLAVSKRLDADGYAYPSVVIRVAANGSGPVAVRLVESLPPGVDATAVGFRTDEGYEHWAVADEGRIVYENVVEAGESVSTLYGIAVDPERLSASLNPPTVEAAPVDDRAALDSDRAATLDDRTIIGDDRTTLDDDRIDVTVLDADGNEVLAADRQTSPRGGDRGGSEITMNQDTPSDDERDTRSGDAQDDRPTDQRDSDSTDTSDSPETSDADEGVLYRGGSAAAAGSNGTAEPSGQPGTSRGDEPTDRDSDSPGADDRTGDGSSRPDRDDSSTVAERVAFELRRGDPPEQAVATLRSELQPDTTGSVDAKLDHCLRRIGELDAYVDALEAFLDDEGTARQLLTELRDDIDRVEARTEDVAERLDTVESTQSGLESRLSSVETELEALDERVGAVEDLDESVEALDGTVRETRAELTDAVDEVETELARLGEEMESVEQWRATVVDALSGAASSAGESGAD